MFRDIKGCVHLGIGIKGCVLVKLSGAFVEYTFGAAEFNGAVYENAICVALGGGR